MKRFFWLALCACCAVCLAESRDKTVPSIRCDASSFYVGLTQDQTKAQVDHGFRIVNTGSQPLEIESAERACGCSESAKKAYDFDFKPLIEPGGSTKLRIRYGTAPVSGTPDLREFAVRFTDKAVAPLGLTVLSKRLTPLTLFPDRDVLVLCKESEAISKTLFVVMLEGNSLDLTLRETSRPGFNIQVKRLSESADINLPDSVWAAGSVFAVRWVSNSPCSEVAGSHWARFSTNHPEFPEIELHLTLVDAR